ncbi:MAG: class I SAM-dependent methyltransferase [Myxococcales bacterium]|nr:class I SAM-dependent methyltransferase [Myxococcales bacterium]
MKLFVPPEIDAYVEAHTRARPPLFEELRARTYAEVPSPQMQVGRVEGTLLKLLCALTGARRVLEIGTFTGYSALCMAEALPDDGEVVTCDLDPASTTLAQSFFDRSEHGRKIRIVLGDARTTLRALDDRPFDVAFLDADKTGYPEYYELVLPRLRPGGLLVADNVLWSGEVLAPETDDARALVRFNARVQVDERVENVMLPVRDGIMLARKR